MCCRYVLSEGTEDFAKYFNAVFEDRIGYKPNYNTVPGDKMPVVSQNMNGWRTIEYFSWGLLPYWATEEINSENIIYVRAETLGDKSKFRPYFANRRCLIPANGFYKWKKIRGKSIPFYNSPEHGSFLAMAGLYSKWESPTGELIPTFCLITSPSGRPDGRVPVVLPPKIWEFWLDPANQNTDKLQKLLFPADPVELKSHPVSNKVNNPDINNRELILPVTTNENS